MTGIDFDARDALDPSAFRLPAMNRRTFVSSLATVGAAAVTAPRVLGAAMAPKPTVGLIGAGWYGGVNLTSLFRHAGVEAVALCDVNSQHLSETLDLVAKFQSRVPRTFANYRDMLADHAPDIVIVATPDHWHALPAIEAMQAGSDVFLEKPIGIDVVEGEALVAAARKYDRVVQVNTQRRSLPIFRTARDKFIRSGRLGRIGRVETFCYTRGQTQGFDEPVPVPDHLDYENWTGPAPMRPFSTRLEDRGWRRYQAYGNGLIGDMGVHKIDIARWMLGLGWPNRISSTGGIRFPDRSDATIPDHQQAVLEFPEYNMTWDHRTWGRSPIRQVRHWSDNWGVRVIGMEGTLDVTMLHYTFTPAEDDAVESWHALSPDGDPANADFSNGTAGWIGVAEKNHAEDFMAARENCGRCIADVEEGHISSSCCQLANLALELGRPLSYDPETRSVRGDAEATAKLARTYRGPWEHPQPDTV